VVSHCMSTRREHWSRPRIITDVRITLTGMGLGKTFVGSEKLKQLGSKVNLVVCQKSKVQDWVDHFRTYYPEYKTYDATSAKKDEKRSYFYGFWLTYRNGSFFPSIIVINYDLLWRRPDLMDLRSFTLMLDESSLIQNPSAKRTKFILKMQPENVILLSGTPTGGKYERLWTQMHLLGWGISRKLYDQTFMIWDYIDNWQTGYKIPVVKGYKNIPRLKDKMREYGCIFLKTEECFDLPQQQDLLIRVDSSADYKRFMKHRYLQRPDGTELVGDTTLTARLYARQLCGQYSKDKLAAVTDLIDSTEDRLIIFYNFTAEMEMLRKICGDRPVSIVNGSTKDLRAYEQYSDSVTLIQYQAGAHGLNLQKARRIIYYTLPESSELFEQSRKRIHRIGQEQTCFYYIPICRGSIEEKILQALKMRRDYTDALFKQDYQ